MYRTTERCQSRAGSNESPRMVCSLGCMGFPVPNPFSPGVCLCGAHTIPPSRVPHSHSLGAPQGVLSPCCLCWPWNRFSHTFFPIQVSVSLPVHDNAPLHTGCVLQVLREMIKPLSAYCPFSVSMATKIKCFFSHISGMPFTSFLPTFQFPSGGGDAHPAASPGTDPYGKGSVLLAPPGQMLERMGSAG